jgi:hypothetical protein
VTFAAADTDVVEDELGYLFSLATLDDVTLVDVTIDVGLPICWYRTRGSSQLVVFV